MGKNWSVSKSNTNSRQAWANTEKHHRRNTWPGSVGWHFSLCQQTGGWGGGGHWLLWIPSSVGCCFSDDQEMNTENWELWEQARSFPSLSLDPSISGAWELSHHFSQGSSRIPTDNFLCHLSVTPKPSFQTNCLLQFLPTRRTWLTDNLPRPPRSPQILPEMSFRKMSKI